MKTFGFKQIALHSIDSPGEYRWDLWSTDMDEAKFTLAQSRASEVLFNDFRSIAEATTPAGGPRYALRPTLIWLARFLVGRGTGPNRDSAIFELCHLVLFVESTRAEHESRDSFFLGQERITTSAFKTYFESRAPAIASCALPMELTSSGVSISLSEHIFEVRFSRMPALVALYEFLISMDSFKYFETLDQAFSALNAGSGHTDSLRAATQSIASVARQYRTDHLPNEWLREKFNSVITFLKQRHQDNDVIDISDDDLLEFWRDHASTKGFRSYRNVFDAFVRFIQAHTEEIWIQNLENSKPLGTDRELGEVEPDAAGDSVWETGEWISPFEILDTEPANRINFFKKSSEREPLEALMEYGPYAVALPLAFLRFDTFGQIQIQISNDLRVKRGAESVRQRITCDNARSYSENKSQLDSLSSHVDKLEKAALYALHRTSSAPEGDNITPLATLHVAPTDTLEIPADRMQTLMNEAEQVFHHMTRKGFQAVDLDDPEGDPAEGFRVSAGALVTIAGILNGYRSKLAALDNGEPNLEGCFSADRDVFSRQFEIMYGGNA